MPVAFPSIRVDQSNDTHHLWCNNGTWWLHYTVHFDHRVRRIRKSLRTRALGKAIALRDQHLREIAERGEVIPDRLNAPTAAAAERCQNAAVETSWSHATVLAS
jgi:hypothetical protein